MSNEKLDKLFINMLIINIGIAIHALSMFYIDNQIVIPNASSIVMVALIYQNRKKLSDVLLYNTIAIIAIGLLVNGFYIKTLNNFIFRIVLVFIFYYIIKAFNFRKEILFKSIMSTIAATICSFAAIFIGNPLIIKLFNQGVITMSNWISYVTLPVVVITFIFAILIFILIDKMLNDY